MTKERLSFSEQIREAIQDADETRYAIAKATGIAESALSRFMSGERGLTTETLDKLAEHLGLEVVKRKRRS